MALLPLTVLFAVMAGLCAFVIDYEQGSHRFTRARARRRALTTGLVAAAFFAALGVILGLTLLR